MVRDVELLESDGFNLYSTDVEEAFPPGSALIRRARHVVLFLGAVLAFICGVWIFDGMLDWMDAGQSQNLAELKSKTGHLEEQVNQLSAKDSNVGPKNDKFYKKYFKKCDLSNPYPYGQPSPGCLFNDMDLGCTSNQTFWSSYERECVSIPSLSSHDFGDGASTFRCRTDVSDVGEVSTLPSELGGPYAGSAYEWTAKKSEAGGKSSFVCPCCKRVNLGMQQLEHRESKQRNALKFGASPIAKNLSKSFWSACPDFWDRWFSWNSGVVEVVDLDLQEWIVLLVRMALLGFVVEVVERPLLWV